MSIQEYIYSELRKAGMTPEGACAVLGNLQAESAFIPNNVEDRSGISDAVYTARVDSSNISKEQFMHDSYGYGLAQWTYFSRKGLLWDFAKMKGKSIGDYTMQVEFLIWEMKKYFPDQWKLCCSTSGLVADQLLHECTHELLYKWENPAEKMKNMEYRIKYAREWYGMFRDMVIFDDSSKPDVPASPGSSTPAEVDEDGVKIDKTWPPRMLDKHCDDFKEVKLLESLLWCHGYNVVIDGIFGDALDSKLRKFQQENGLDADGVCGNMTWKALMKLPDRW